MNPERLQAVNGVCGSLVREVREHVCSFTVFSNFSEWGGNRGRDFLALSQIVYLVKAGKLPATLPEPDKLTPFLEGKVGDIDDLRDGIKHSFTIFARLLSHPHYGRTLSEKEISPVEFVVGVHAISSLKKRLTDCELADALKKIWGHAREKSTAKKKATKTSSSKAYVDMRNFLERLLAGKVPLERPQGEQMKAVDVPKDCGLDMSVQHEQVPKVEERQPTSKKRSRAQASLAAADDDDDDVPLSTIVKTERKPPPPKRAKLNRRATREVAESDENMDSDGSAEIVSTVPPKRTAASGSSIRKPSQVGTRTTTSAAATRVKRPPSSTARESLATVAAGSSKASTSATAAIPSTKPNRASEVRKVPRPTAPRSSSTQSFATAVSSASPRNTPGPSSAATARPAQPRSASHTTPSAGNVPLPRDASTPEYSVVSSHGPGGSNANRMERLQTLKQMSRPGTQSATPPLQYPPSQFSQIPKMPTPGPEEFKNRLESLPPITRCSAQPAVGSRRPPAPWQTSASASASSSGAGSSADSVLDTLQAKRDSLSRLKFSRNTAEPSQRGSVSFLSFVPVRARLTNSTPI